mmetsp:Transcript_11068/g.22671  ORF Transcript_11068/g.22671 Transcript_11068/m.22671 type:complete len:107 (+) Transcript_11068:969-1289(+)
MGSWTLAGPFTLLPLVIPAKERATVVLSRRAERKGRSTSATKNINNNKLGLLEEPSSKGLLTKDDEEAAMDGSLAIENIPWRRGRLHITIFYLHDNFILTQARGGQ